MKTYLQSPNEVKIHCPGLGEGPEGLQGLLALGRPGRPLAGAWEGC